MTDVADAMSCTRRENCVRRPTVRAFIYTGRSFAEESVRRNACFRPRVYGHAIVVRAFSPPNDRRRRRVHLAGFFGRMIRRRRLRRIYCCRRHRIRLGDVARINRYVRATLTRTNLRGDMSRRAVVRTAGTPGANGNGVRVRRAENFERTSASRHRERGERDDKNPRRGKSEISPRKRSFGSSTAS